VRPVGLVRTTEVDLAAATRSSTRVALNPGIEVSTSMARHSRVKSSEACFALLYFWYRVDVLTKRRESSALKAIGAVTVVQAFPCGEILVGLPSLPVGGFLAGVAALLAANYEVLRRSAWKEFEQSFALHPAGVRRGWMLFAGGGSLAALALLLGAADLLRSGK